ncbi:type IV secretory system conjugative DNA transfer family protein [Streptomyces acidicola]|uniref:type IV secretory system conjugative DNA transfer family protein n=1 Tax=Streptomyces acidicola TaxID=2596892 RepID=UPI00380BAB0A
MRPDERDRGREAGGIPDGLLIGLLGFLLGMSLMVWTATGLAGWFTRGGWPDGVTFVRTPLALRHLIGQPHDIAGAWPDTPADQLSGYGLFWGLFIGQLMVLVVLTVFVLGTVARWRAVRARRKTGQGSGRTAGRTAGRTTRRTKSAEQWEPEELREPERPAEAQGNVPLTKPSYTAPAPRPAPAHEPEPTPTPAPVPAAPHTAQANPAATDSPTTGLAAADSAATSLAALAALAAEAAALTRAAETTALTKTPVTLPGPRGPVILGPAATRHPLAAQAARDAEGPALIVTSNPALWADTKDARAKLGPVHLYDPSHLCDTPARLHWSPSRGCEDKAVAAARAAALLAPVRPTAKIDQALADVAETLLRSYLHAAAVDGRTVRHIHRWAQGSQVQDAVRALRTNPKAASGTAGELESALTSHPERRDMAQELTARALSALSTINVRESCTPNRTDSLALDSFVHEGGTLYVVGEPIEDPRATPGAMPLLTALTASVVERGRRMAERSSSGRLDPPLTLILDDVAAVAPLPQLPDLLTTGADRGMPTLALMRSREQGRSRWPQYELPV